MNPYAMEMNRAIAAAHLFVLSLASATVARGDGSGVAASQTAPESCAAASNPGAPDADLYCIELLPAAEIERASGPHGCSRRLLHSASPLRPRANTHTTSVQLRDLPEPSSLGLYTAYMAWATTPQLNPVVKLGDVRNGTLRVGPSPSTVPDPDHGRGAAAVPERSGRLVLRGTRRACECSLTTGVRARGIVAAKEHRPSSTQPAHETPDAAGERGLRRRCTPRWSMPPALMTLRPDVLLISRRPAGCDSARAAARIAPARDGARSA